MSYYQAICEKGHYFEYDPWIDPMDVIQCHICQAPPAWDNKVIEDDSGGEWDKIPLELLREKYLISDEISETCNLGHKHTTQYPIFRIPEKKETEALRTK